LCSPGNPTAKALPLSDISKIAENAPDSLVVVDEAYIDFCTNENSTALALLQSHANVCVLQTLSKAFGLAAIRCGFVLGPPDVVQLLNNVKAPYNVNELTSQMAIKALDHTDRLHKNIQALLAQREIVASALLALPFVKRVYHSDANFLLFRLDKNAQQVYKLMADKGSVVTRYRGTELHCDECIRVTIGTPEENEAFLKQLQAMYEELA
jgi:histidinol-phosphate aminotransferase